jgi:hypothetical protein
LEVSDDNDTDYDEPDEAWMHHRMMQNAARRQKERRSRRPAWKPNSSNRFGGSSIRSTLNGVERHIAGLDERLGIVEGFISKTQHGRSGRPGGLRYGRDEFGDEGDFDFGGGFGSRPPRGPSGGGMDGQERQTFGRRPRREQMMDHADRGFGVDDFELRFGDVYGKDVHIYSNEFVQTNVR